MYFKKSVLGLQKGLIDLSQENKEAIVLKLDGVDTEQPSLPTDVVDEYKKSEAISTQQPLKESLTIDVLSEEEQKQVKAFAKTIDLKDSNLILQYGISSQKKVANFSETTLSKIRTKDLGEIGESLIKLTGELKDITKEPQEGGFFSFFKKSSDWLTNIKDRYSTIEGTINGIVKNLENHRIQLLKDITMFDQLYDTNQMYYKELTMYILAGKERLNKALAEELPVLMEKAKQTGLPSDAQTAKDFEDMCNRFDKKLHDLILTRTISIQMAPQIRLIQNNDNVLVEKIQTSIINTIPLWKNQMTLALGIANSHKALKAQQAVSDLTNELLKKNSDMLKTSTIEVAKESERSIVDLETLRHTHEQLISTIDEVFEIQQQGIIRRVEAEAEIFKLENELKNKLLTNFSK